MKGRKWEKGGFIEKRKTATTRQLVRGKDLTSHQTDDRGIVRQHHRQGAIDQPGLGWVEGHWPSTYVPAQNPNLEVGPVGARMV